MAMQVTPFVEPVNLVPYADRFVANVAGAQMDAQKAALEITQMGDTLQRQRDLYSIELTKAKMAQETMQLELNRTKAMNSVEMLNLELARMKKLYENDLRIANERNELMDIERAIGPKLAVALADAQTANDPTILVKALESARDQIGEEKWGLYATAGEFSPLKVKQMFSENEQKVLASEIKTIELNRMRNAAALEESNTKFRRAIARVEDSQSDALAKLAEFGGVPIVDWKQAPGSSAQYHSLRTGLKKFLTSVADENKKFGNLTPEHREMLGHLEDLADSLPEDAKSGWQTFWYKDTRREYIGKFPIIRSAAKREALAAFDEIVFYAGKLASKDPVERQVAANRLAGYLTSLKMLSDSQQMQKDFNAKLQQLSRGKRDLNIQQGLPPDDYEAEHRNAVNDAIRSQAQTAILDGKRGTVVP